MAAASKSSKVGARQLAFAEFVEGVKKRAEEDGLQRHAAGVFGVVLALMGLGLLIQASYQASVLGPAEFRASLIEQLGYRVLAVFVLAIGYLVGPRGIRRALPALVAIAGVLLILCLIPGIGAERNGSSRWLEFAGISFQPSELARVVVVIWIADRCVRLGERVCELRHGVLPILALTSVFFGLVAVETDVGGAMLLLLCALSTMWVGGAQPLHLTLSSVGLGGGTVAAAAFFVPYVRQRLAMFMGSVQNPQVEGTAEALASGGLLGVGLGRGESRLQAIPYLESDYVFAQIGEEMGLFGMVLVLGLLLALLAFAVRLVLSVPDRYEALAAFGLFVSVGLSAMLHVQVVAGLAPPKGMTLPFISDGGTSLVVSSLAVGLALGVARRPAPSAPCSPSNDTA